MKAFLKNHHQSPRKTRLVADMIRGKSVVSAKAALAFTPKKSSHAIEKLLDSAVANAGGKTSLEMLFVKTITVDKGLVMKRARPFARGRSGRLHKTQSRVALELGEMASAKKSAKKTIKKATVAASTK